MDSHRKTLISSLIKLILSISLVACEKINQVSTALSESTQKEGLEPIESNSGLSLLTGTYELSSVLRRNINGKLTELSVEGKLFQKLRTINGNHFVSQQGQIRISALDEFVVIGCPRFFSNDTEWQFSLNDSGFVVDGKEFESNCFFSENEDLSQSNYKILQDSESYQINTTGYERRVTLDVAGNQLSLVFKFDRTLVQEDNGKDYNPVHAVLQGDWRSGCVKDASGSPASFRWLVASDFMERHVSSYLDTDCQRLLRKNSEYYQAKSVFSTMGDYYIDLRLDAAKLKIADLQQAISYGIENLWGISTWPVWKDVDNTNRVKNEPTSAEFIKGQRLLQRVRVKGDTLYFSDYPENNTANPLQDKTDDQDTLVGDAFEKFVGPSSNPQILAPLEYVTDIAHSNIKVLNLYDPEGDDLSLFCDQPCPEGFVIEGNVLRFNFNSPSKYEFYLTVQDSSGNASKHPISIVVNKTFQVYEDKDGDGVGTGSAVIIKVHQDNLPPGYSPTNTDCNDDNELVWQLLEYSHVDKDGDGYFTKSEPGQICSGDKLPDTHALSVNQEDCDDENPFAWKILPYSFRTVGELEELDPISPGLICAGDTLPQGFQNYGSLSGGLFHTCSLSSKGAVMCWGNSGWGELGNDTYLAFKLPVQVKAITPTVVSLSTQSYWNSCAISDSGGVECWGRNTNGQLGDLQKSGNKSSLPVKATELKEPVVSITSGLDDEAHNCAVMKTGALQCWGRSHFGQLGNDSYTDRLAPTPVLKPSEKRVVSVSLGAIHSCAVDESGSAYCWGSNHFGQLGQGTSGSGIHSRTPLKVSALGEKVVQIASGKYSSCALLKTGAVECWGYNIYGQLGNGNKENSSIPVPVVGLSSDVIAITSGLFHACALLNTGKVKCWGINGSGQLGNNDGGSGVSSSEPTEVIDLPSAAVQISCGGYHSCAVLDTGEVYCWGEGQHGQLGNGSTEDSYRPSKVSGLDLTPE